MCADRIRPIVVGIPRHDDEIFVAEFSDPATDERFYRPIGGEITFTEYSRDALVREFDEELDLSVRIGEYLGSIENVFEFGGRTKHEVVYDIEPLSVLRERPQLEGQDDGGVTYTASWNAIDQFSRQEPPLYPDGLLELLQSGTTHVIG